MTSVNGFSSDAFNGVLSTDKSPVTLQTLPLYSPSGLYTGTDTYVGEWETVLKSMISDTNIFPYGNQVVNNLDEFFEKYSRTPYVSTTNRVAWRKMDEYAFENTSYLSSSIIYIIEVITIVLSILFTIIVATLLFKSNSKKIATLWTIGYRKSEISSIFLRIYIVPIVISLVFAIPLSIGLLIMLKTFIMDFGQILIPFAISWWMPIIALLGIALIFIGISVGLIFSQKQRQALESFKGD